MRVLSLLAIVVLAAGAGCGSEADSDAEPGTVEQPSTELEIAFWSQGKTSESGETWTLTCDPAGGTHPDPEDACRQLAAIDDPFAPPPTDEMCTEQYGGPEQAMITGTYRGAPVSYPLSRTNGCEIGRWENLRFLLPSGGNA